MAVAGAALTDAVALAALTPEQRAVVLALLEAEAAATLERATRHEQAA